METKRANKVIVALAAAGTLFAGYLSFYKLATGTCALSEPCPIFMGYPACWYGFGMFLLMLAFAAGSLARPSTWPGTRRLVLGVALLGILFAAQYVGPEISAWLWGGARYSLVLPSCAYGLIFYVAILLVALRAKPGAPAERAA